MIEQNYKEPSDTLLRMRKGKKYYELNNNIKDLTDEELTKLQILNTYLLEYEKYLKVQIKEHIAFALNKVNNLNDWVNDFEGCEVELYFYLAENDPNYSDDNNNIIIIMSQMEYAKKEIYGLADGENHIDTPLRNNHPLSDYHCWSFHGLYDHTQLTWKEILRIDSIDVNIKLKTCHNSSVSLYK